MRFPSAALGWLRGVTWPSLAAALALACTLVALACGDSDFTSEDTASPTATPNLVTDRAIEARGTGTPARAFLEWWRAIQFADAVAFEERTAASAFRGLPRPSVFGAIRKLANIIGKPRIVETRRDGPRKATLRVYVQSFSPQGVVQSQTRYAFAMVRGGGDWKVADLSYIEISYADVLDAERDARRKKQR